MPRFRKAPTARCARLHDKHAALVSIGKHLGMFVDVVRGAHAHYGIPDKEMTAEEWKRLHVTER